MRLRPCAGGGEHPSLLTRFMACLGRKPKTSKEHEILKLAVGGDASRVNNRVITARYTVLTFLPFSILGQFKHATNAYFLIIFIIAVLGDNNVSGLNWFQSPYAYDGFLTSLSIVVAIGVLFDLGYDVNRHREDWKVNGRKANRLLPDGISTEQCSWDELLPGDMVVVHKEEMFPCDLVFLRANRNPNLEQEDFDAERCYVETSNVDGETNLKLRLTPSPLPPGDNLFEALHGCEMSYDLPSAKLEFSGLLYRGGNSDGNSDGDSEATPRLHTPLVFKTLLLRGSILKNTHSIIGVVVYAGRETKGVMSSSETKSKMSNAMLLVNKAIMGILFVGLIMVLVSAGVSTTMSTSTAWYLGNPPPYVFGDFWSSFFTFVILYSNLLPISLVIATTITNFIQAVFVNWDQDIPGSKCRTLELAQEIGQVSFVFSDKTGTLTRNEMKFVRCAVFGEEIDEEVRSSDLDTAELFPVLLQRREDSEQVREFLLAIALCHTVLVEGDEFNAEGPDEEALVGGVAQLGYKLVKTGRSGYEVESEHFPRALGAGRCKFDILSINAFDSTRKRMSSVVRFPDGSIELYVKGADSIMLNLLAESEDIEKTRELYRELEAFALEGLRTLVFAKKQISRAEWDAFERDIIGANALLGAAKDDALGEIAARMETNLFLLGATAIEDRLQDGVSDTLKCFRDAGIKTWVLTGDKVETAINIGYSSGLLTKQMRAIEVCGKDVDANDRAVQSIGRAFDPEQLARIERANGARRRSSATLRGALSSLASGTPTSRAAGAGNAQTVSFVGETISGEDPYEITKQTKLLISNGFSEFAKRRRHLARKLHVPAMPRRRSTAAPAAKGIDDLNQTLDEPALEDDGTAANTTLLTMEQNTTLENTVVENTVLFDEEGDLDESAVPIPITPANNPGTTAGGAAYYDPFQNMNELEASNLALVVDGDALHGILHDVKDKDPKAVDDPHYPITPRELKFLAVAKMFKVVIACRVSPRQKALLVRLVRKGVRIGGKEPITLAVGDGANDVGMIQESRVGVGIAGREGSQAVNSADFAIHQFRYLRKLLLVHGRWNYRRISFLVLFIFYAHIFPVIIAFGYNFCNMWSGTTPYPFVWVIAYSYLVVIPAIVIAAFNRDISIATALEFPSIYISGRANLSMGRFKISEYVFKAGLHATILCVLVFLVFQIPALSYYDLGTTMYWCILLTVLSRLAFECFTWTWIAALVFFIMLIVFPIIEYLMYDSSIEFSGSVLFGPWSAWVWATAFVTASCCFILDMLMSLVRRALFPNLIDVVLEADRQKDGVFGVESLVQTLNVFSKPRELNRQAVFQSVRDHRSTIPIAPPNRSGFAYGVLEGGGGGGEGDAQRPRTGGGSTRWRMLPRFPTSRHNSTVSRPSSPQNVAGQQPIAVASASNLGVAAAEDNKPGATNLDEFAPSAGAGATSPTNAGQSYTATTTATTTPRAGGAAGGGGEEAS